MLSASLMGAIRCSDKTAREITDHLVDADLSLNQWSAAVDAIYHKGRRGAVDATKNQTGAWVADGRNRIGITALRATMQKGCELMKEESSNGMATVGAVNCDHTGRIGEFAEDGARHGALTILISVVVVTKYGSKSRPTEVPKADFPPILTLLVYQATAGG